MKFTDEFRNEKLVKALLAKIYTISKKPVRIMEVCGGHTMAIRRYGIHTLLPDTIELLSGPGCPVCVTDQQFIDTAIAYAKMPVCILLTYGDMLRVPGTTSSLDREKAAGSDVRIIYSTIQALEIARKNPSKNIVFAAIGFETTVPGTAIALKQAKEEKLTNFYVFCAHKTMPEAMAALIEEGIPINGYIGPGHVCAVAGSKIFDALASNYNMPIVISGFEPVDLVQAVYILVKMIEENRTGVEIQYNRLVTHQGNLKAQRLVNEVFEPDTQYWRGIGAIPGSGLKIRKEYSAFDVLKQLPVKVKKGAEPKGCICGEILKGLKKPTECKLFGKVCMPAHPIGACMVSSEGSCHAYYNYQDLKAEIK
jgi:hydrogenase expression/formation protein HypD